MNVLILNTYGGVGMNMRLVIRHPSPNNMLRNHYGQIFSKLKLQEKKKMLRVFEYNIILYA